MKLYNLFKEVILEENNRRLISEGVSTDDVIKAIEGKYNVNIMYRDSNYGQPSKRYIQVYNLAKTKAGNDCIRAYQIFGGSKTTPKTGAWKIFRLDRIELWKPTNMKWQQPISNYADVPRYNQTGDRSMSVVNKMVDVNTFNNKNNSGNTPENLNKEI